MALQWRISRRKIGCGPGRSPRPSRITSCSIRCCRQTGCSTGCFTRSRCAPIAAINLETYCSCSRERVEELLRRFTSEDLKDMVVDGEVWVTCEFCNSRYRFDPASFSKSDDGFELLQLFVMRPA